ncbi:MAG: hypothetical protein K5986_04955 [Clostridium sp.]|nr:hypothetical protein [Clostridium sp.]
MYISLYDLFWGIVGIMGFIALIYIIIVLRRFAGLISSLNDIISTNKSNINKLCGDLPDISDNIKNVSEVLTEVTAEAIEVKDNLADDLGVIKDIISIIISIFSKK